MPETIGALLGGSWAFFTKNIKTIFIGSVVFGLLLGGSQFALQQSTMGALENNFGNTDKLMDLTKRMEAGDSAALEEYLAEMEAMGGEGEMAAQMMAGVFTSMLPGIGLAVIVSLIITLVSSGYYMVIAIEGHQSAGPAFGRALSLALPLLGVWLWAFIRSFAWIPIIGFIPALILGPRLLFSSVILVNEKKGVMESVKLSLGRSKGYWLKIVGNFIVMAICIMLVSMVAGFGLAFVGAASPIANVVLSGIVGQLTSAFGAIFMVRLATTVMQNPKSAPQAA